MCLFFFSIPLCQNLTMFLKPRPVFSDFRVFFLCVYASTCLSS